MKQHGKKLFLISAVLAALFPCMQVYALAVPAAPPLDRPVIDQTNTLTSAQVDTLVQQINTSRTQKDYQVGVLIIKSLEGAAIEDYSLKVARVWGIGDKTQNNGVLLLVAMDERRVRIEVGRGIEADLTDAESGRIIRNTITPQFKKGDYYSGISLGLQNIAAQVEGKPQQDTSTKPAVSNQSIVDMVTFGLFAALSVIPWFGAMLARTKSWWLGGVLGAGIGAVVVLFAAWALWSIIVLVLLTMVGLLLDWAVSRNFSQTVHRGTTPDWWAGGPWIGGWGGGDSGGGGSFGGGDFGGGGASGSW